MAGRILKDDIDALRERADIVAIVGDHTKLKKAGQRWKGLCPFHSEKTPSFTVDAGNNLYYCFGCNEGGDLYDFLMKVEGLDFVEAVEQLARRTGFTLRYEEMSAGQKRALGERSRLAAISLAASEFFVQRLYSPDGTIAREYLKDRGFGREEADRFGLGYAPNEWETLSRHLQTERGFGQDDIEKVGLATRNDRGGLRDRFRGRLIFPVRDLAGDVIGFGGRILPGLDYGDFEPPKYYNSPETPLYKKTRVLYGIHEARADIVRSEEVLICEGYTDVMALHQAGFGNAVATCGTAVGTEHFRILSRYADRITLAFDSDAAGVKAAHRAWEAARELEEELGSDADHTFELRVLVLGDGQDPADFVRTSGVEALEEEVRSATPVVPFLIRRVVADGDLTTERGRTETLRSALELLKDESDPELRRVYARTEVADAVGVSLEFVQKTAGRMGVELDTHQGISVRGPSRDRGHAVRPDVNAARARRERSVLQVALQQPHLLPEEWFELTVDDFLHPKARPIFAAIMAAGGAGVDLDGVLKSAPDDETRGMIQRVALGDPEVEPSETGVAQEVRQMLADRADTEIAATREALAVVNMTVDPELGMELSRRLGELEHRRRELREYDGA